MNAIINESDLCRILYAENPAWQKEVFEKTGVYVHFNIHGGILLSECGYIHLDEDVDYNSTNGEDKTVYVSITSVEGLINYIREMESYHKCLLNESFGLFTKAELFWATQLQIILAKQNQKRPDGSLYQDWGLYRIYTADRPCHPFSECNVKKTIVLDMALVDYDSTEIWIPQSENLKLPHVLKQVIVQMNQMTDNIDDLPKYSVHPERQVIIPVTYEEIKELIQPGGIFSWLR